MTENLLSINEFSRPGKKLSEVLGIVMHWTANPNVSAENNRLYFDSRKNGKLGYGSAHYIIGLSGEVIRCIPDQEVAYHVGSSQIDPASGKIYTDLARERFGAYASTNNSPNNCTIGIELCPIDWEGNFNPATIEAAIDLCATLCRAFRLKARDVVTHHEVVGWKDCPRLWTNHPEYLENFRAEVEKRI